MDLEELSRRAFAAFHDATDRVPDAVVTPAVPILFFGDIERYRNSALRVITVGLNPSGAEFRATNSWGRFPAASGLSQTATAGEHARYVAALSDYFRVDPYDTWFDSYEPLLEGMGASFYDGFPNTALHTDICSPVATCPTWSRLPDPTRTALIQPGRALWHDLMPLLRPHVILASVAREHLDAISLVSVDEWAVLHQVDRANPYTVVQRRLLISTRDTALMVFGRAAQKPFGLVSNTEKRRIGTSVRRFLDA